MKEILQAEIDLLLNLPYVQAYTGSLHELKQKSYVDYSEILKLLNEKKKQLKDLNS